MKRKPKVEHVYLQIEALKELLKAYQEKRLLKVCPLCLADDRIKNSENYNNHKHCDCPWVWITGMSCAKWNSKRGYKISQNYKLKFPHQTKLRIRQIKRWIKILEKYVEDNGGINET